MSKKKKQKIHRISIFSSILINGIWNKKNRPATFFVSAPPETSMVKLPDFGEISGLPWRRWVSATPMLFAPWRRITDAFSPRCRRAPLQGCGLNDMLMWLVLEEPQRHGEWRKDEFVHCKDLNWYDSYVESCDCFNMYVWWGHRVNTFLLVGSQSSSGIFSGVPEVQNPKWLLKWCHCGMLIGCITNLGLDLNVSMFDMCCPVGEYDDIWWYIMISRSIEFGAVQIEFGSQGLNGDVFIFFELVGRKSPTCVDTWWLMAMSASRSWGYSPPLRKPKPCTTWRSTVHFPKRACLFW